MIVRIGQGHFLVYHMLSFGIGMELLVLEFTLQLILDYNFDPSVRGGWGIISCFLYHQK